MKMEEVEYVFLLFKGVKLCFHIFIIDSTTKSCTLCMYNKRQKYAQKALTRQDFLVYILRKIQSLLPAGIYCIDFQIFKGIIYLVLMKYMYTYTEKKWGKKLITSEYWLVPANECFRSDSNW